MSFSTEHARQLFASRGPVGFVRTMHSLLGLRNEHGVKNRDSEGRQVLENQQIRPDNVSIKGLATALFGETNIERRLGVVGPTIAELDGDVLEAGNDIVPGMFADITAYNETVAGLLEVKMLEAYNRPEFLAPQLTTNIPSNKVQEKFIGISTPADAAQERKPGAEHPRATLSERYVTTPITKNRGNAIDVTREAVMFDLTRQLMDHAELVGKTLALRKEYLVWDVVLGITNNYTYDGTTYYTYLPSSGNWLNSLNNDLTDWTCLDKCYITFSKMVDQETNQPISIDAKDLIVMPGKKALMEKILSDTQVRQAESSSLIRAGYGPNPIGGNWNTPMVSQYAYKRLIDYPSDAVSGGLIYNHYNQDGSTYPWVTSSAVNSTGLSAADGIWFAGNFKKAFVYIENMPLTVVRAAPTSYTMADRGLVFSLFCDEMGIPAIKEPRYVIRNQGFTPITAAW